MRRSAYLLAVSAWILTSPFSLSHAAPTNQQQYLDIYLKINDAEHLEKQGDFRGALDYFKDCYTRLQKLHNTDPNWETALVVHRMDDCKAKIIDLQVRAADQPPSVPPTPAPALNLTSGNGTPAVAPGLNSGSPDDVNELKLELQAVKKELEITKAKLVDSQSQLDTYRTQLDTVNSQLAALKSQQSPEAADDRMGKLLTQNKELTDKLASAQKEIDGFKTNPKSKLAMAMAQLKNVQDQYSASQEANKALQDTTTNLKAQLDQAQADLVVANQKLAAVPAVSPEYTTLKRENEIMRGILTRELQEQAHRDMAKRLFQEEYDNLKLKSKVLQEQVDILATPMTPATNDEERTLLASLKVSGPDVTPIGNNLSAPAGGTPPSTDPNAASSAPASASPSTDTNTASTTPPATDTNAAPATTSSAASSTPATTPASTPSTDTNAPVNIVMNTPASPGDTSAAPATNAPDPAANPSTVAGAPTNAPATTASTATPDNSTAAVTPASTPATPAPDPNAPIPPTPAGTPTTPPSSAAMTTPSTPPAASDPSAPTTTHIPAATTTVTDTTIKNGGDSNAQSDPTQYSTKARLPDDMRETAQDAADLFKNQKYDESAAKYQSIIDKYPESLYAWSNLGVVRFQQGKFDDALKALQQAVKLSPTDAFSYSNLGIVYYQLNQYENAIDALNSAKALDPNDPKTHNYLGCACSQKGWQEVAEKEFRKAIELDPNFGDAHFNLALVYATSKPPSLELARREYNRALELGIAKDARLEKLLKNPQQ
jgi:Flp pilus assembly protein TadD